MSVSWVTAVIFSINVEVLRSRSQVKEKRESNQSRIHSVYLLDWRIIRFNIRSLSKIWTKISVNGKVYEEGEQNFADALVGNSGV